MPVKPLGSLPATSTARTHSLLDIGFASPVQVIHDLLQGFETLPEFILLPLGDDCGGQGLGPEPEGHSDMNHRSQDVRLQPSPAHSSGSEHQSSPD